MIDLPAIEPVLDDPRLAAALERVRANDDAGAARAVEEARKDAKLSPSEECAWSYVAGRLALSAGLLAEATTAFDRAAAAGCVLAPHASLRAAQAYAGLGRPDEAIGRAQAVPASCGAYDEARLIVAEALATKGDTAAAVPIWREHLAASPRGLRWVDTSVRLANALLDHVEGTGPSRAREALELATRVVVEAPRYAESSGANAARQRASAELRELRAPAPDLTLAEKARLARTLLDAGDPKQALTMAEALLLGKGPRDVLCRAAIVRAQALAKPRAAAPKKGKAAVDKVAVAKAWGDAIARCDGASAAVLRRGQEDDGAAIAIYQGAKASAAAKRVDEAMARYAKFEQRFPKHRLADDARFQGALLALEKGDEARGVAMLSALPDDYPDGDMRSDALFRVALLHLEKGDLDAAKAVLDRAVAQDEGDRHWAYAGRAAYFRAKVAQLAGDMADARQRYESVIRDYPLSFYMIQAYARLATIDPTLAKGTLSDAIAREPTGNHFFTKEHPELGSPEFDRGLRLLEVGELEAARKELSALTGDGADPEVLWAIGYAYNRVGAYDWGHWFSRTRLTDHLAHYPVGRWRVAWETAFPPAFDAIVAKESEAHGVTAPLTWAVMREESAFRPNVRSPANAHGLMQLLPSTAREVAKGTPLPFDEAALHRPEVSVALGTKLLASLASSFPLPLAIAAYNGGSGAVRRWMAARGSVDVDMFIEQIPYEETRNYVKRVLASAAAYTYLYARSELESLLAFPLKLGT